MNVSYVFFFKSYLIFNQKKSCTFNARHYESVNTRSVVTSKYTHVGSVDEIKAIAHPCGVLASVSHCRLTLRMIKNSMVTVRALMIGKKSGDGMVSQKIGWK